MPQATTPEAKARVARAEAAIAAAALFGNTDRDSVVDFLAKTADRSLAWVEAVEETAVAVLGYVSEDEAGLGDDAIDQADLAKLEAAVEAIQESADW